MITLVFYIGAQSGVPIVINDIERVNPGIGGAQYCMLLLAHHLVKDSNYKVYILGKRKVVANKNMNYVRINTDEEFLPNLDCISPNLILLTHFPYSILKQHLWKVKYGIIIWSHNYLYADFCKYIVKNPSIKANVFVGKQQYDRYIDHDVIKKSIHISNMVHDLQTNGCRLNDSRTVVFMGAIMEGKGFLEMCKIWKGILARVSNAKLLVMGSGNLYDEVKLGKLGIASEEYETKFFPYISENGKLLPSVKFLGVVKEEKIDYFKNASVGVVNPSGRPETFGMSILEMATCELPVVTSTTNGYYDTIINGKTGYLCKTLDEISDKIVMLLQDPRTNNQMGKAAKENLKEFCPETIVPSWKSLIEATSNNSLEIRYLNVSKPYSVNTKWLRVANRILRHSFHISFLPSIIDIESFGLYVKKGLLKMMG
jgi:glycosyltransferase involved in cell wall biosynthesis